MHLLETNYINIYRINMLGDDLYVQLLPKSYSVI